MNSKKIFLLTSLMLFLGFTTFAQIKVGPPPPSMPSNNNKKIINEIIDVTHLEQYFIDYCTKKIKAHAIKHEWKDKKTTQTLNSINFRYYRSTVYNSYASYTKKQLEQILELMTSLNKDKKGFSTMILLNPMMQSNLELHVKSLIEGKYIMD
jgi:hypothetical protein